MKASALPFETFEGVVDKIAPAAIVPVAAPGATVPSDPQGTVTIYCRFDAPPAGLRPYLRLS